MLDRFPFQGIDTPFTLENYLLILGAILVYALLTSWAFILFFRLVLRGLTAGGSTVLVVLLGLSAAGLCLAGGGPLVGLLLGLALFFTWAKGLAAGVLGWVACGACFWVVWAPFGELTGIGWMGLIPYMVLCIKSWRLYV